MKIPLKLNRFIAPVSIGLFFLVLSPSNALGQSAEKKREETVERLEERKEANLKAEEELKERHIKNQQKETRKRMKKNQKKADRQRKNKKDPFYKRWFIKS